MKPTTRTVKSWIASLERQSRSLANQAYHTTDVDTCASLYDASERIDAAIRCLALLEIKNEINGIR